MADIRIGISGWTYEPWRGRFYPKKLAQRRELEFASRQVNSIEINGSFYSLQTPKSYELWRDMTPDDFCFSVKGGRFITHMKRLKDVETPLANFFASGVLALGDKLGPFLWQLPPQLPYDAARLEAFFELLPKSTEAAAELAAKHDERLEGRSYTETDEDRPIRHAMEVRHPSFRTAAFFDLLRRHNVAFVVADTANKWLYAEEVTADFVYARLHGETELYASGYDDDSLDRWAGRIRAWTAGTEPADAVRVSKTKLKKKKRDVYVYFDNDVKVRAPFDAMNLLRRVTDFKPAHDLPLPNIKGIPTLSQTLAANAERWPGYRARGKTPRT